MCMYVYVYIYMVQKSIWHTMISWQILIIIMFCFPEYIQITEYKKEKWAKVYVKYYVFICYVNHVHGRTGKTTYY